VKEIPRRFALTVIATQALGTGISLPVLGSFKIDRLWPLRVNPTFEPEQIPAGYLGFPWGPGVKPPGDQSLEGLSTIAGLWLLLGVTTLAIACATLTVLFVRRGSERHAEVVVHAAVGANRVSLLRAVLREPLVLTAVGAALGAILGLAGWILLRASWTAGLQPPRALISPLGLFAIVTPCLFVLAASLYPLRHMRAWIRAPGRIRKIGAVWERMVIAGYVAGLVVLLTVAGLLIRGQGTADRTARSGLETRDTLLVEMQVTEGFDPRATLDALANLPSTGSASLASTGTLRGLGMTDVTLAECDCSSGGLPAPYLRMSVQYHAVSPGFFTNLGIPIQRGREFEAADERGQPLVAVIDRSLAARLRGTDPLEARIRVGGKDVRGPWYSIVGVVPDLDPPGLGTSGTPAPSVYLSSSQHVPSAATLVVRARAPERLEPRIRGMLAGLESGAEVTHVTTLEELLDRWSAPLRWFASLTALLGLGALVLAVQGLHGAISLDVWRRTAEIGVRRAAGATRRDIARLIAVETAKTMALGLVVGLPFAVGFARGLEPAVAGVQPADPLLYASIASILVATAVAGAWGPARRAVRLDPARAIASPG
jgi:hypothetical protein